jgi:RHS repeat-associated protein
VTNSYIYGPAGIPVEQVSSGGTVTYLHHDQQGSVRLLTGSAGTVTGKCTYGAYGGPTCEGTTTSPLGYDGQYTSSDTGLVYMRARAYDPTTAQFLRVDPLVGFTLAHYNYVDDNPLNGSDPSGLCGLGSLGDFCDCFDPTSTGNAAYQGAEALNKVTSGVINLPWVLTRPAFVDAAALLGCAAPGSDAVCPELLAAAWSASSSAVIGKGIESSWCNPGQLSAEETMDSLLLGFGGLSKFAADAAAKQGANALAKTLIRGGPVVTQGLLDAVHN